MLSLLKSTALRSLIHVASFEWLYLVGTQVPDPYLDEYFHIRQADAYWNGQWHVWDPKITTPPGLYLFTYPWIYLCNFLSPSSTFTTLARSINSVSIVLLCVFLLPVVRTQFRKRHGKEATFERPKLAHTALNITLLPPLFFFSGLYYTDVLSVLSVVTTHVAFDAHNPMLVILCGLVSLTFRQTNIFWVAVYLGGKEVLSVLRKSNPSGKLLRNAKFADVARHSWERGQLYDSAVREARIEDYLKCILSIGMAILSQFRNLIVPVLPYVALLGAFGAFVVWNGGVVLGDKDNHIASIHLMQMLYIWPYIAFFSFPILLPSLTPNLLPLLPSSVKKMLPGSPQTSQSTKRPLPRLVVLIPLLAATLVTIHYNTIIHPFTLADNRHYTFYVFRLLTRHPWTKYLVGPIYLFLGWACICALGGVELAEKRSTSKAENKVDEIEQKAKLGSSSDGTKREDVRVSFLILWLLTSTLALASTPLVEPRYFILPWMTWRIQIPLDSISELERDGKQETSSAQTKTDRRVDSLVSEVSGSYALYLETAWLMVVNLVAGYMFLYRGFTWASEPGAVQRFMW